MSFVRRGGDARSGARRGPSVLRLAVQSQPTMPAWRQSAKDLSRTKSVARRRVIGAFRARFFPGSRTEKYHTFLDSNATLVAFFRPASGNDAFLLSRSAAATIRSRGAKINRSRGNGEVDGTIRFVSALPRSRILAAVARARALVSTRKRASWEHTRVISQRCTKRTHDAPADSLAEGWTRSRFHHGSPRARSASSTVPTRSLVRRIRPSRGSSRPVGRFVEHAENLLLQIAESLLAIRHARLSLDHLHLSLHEPLLRLE